MRALAIAIALGGALISASAVRAQPDDLDQEARALFEAGRVAFDAGRYEDALEHFESAYERSQRDRLLYNVGLAADRLGRTALAIRAYSKFLDSVPDSSHRLTVEMRLAELRAQQAAEPEPEPEPEPAPQPFVPVVTTTTPAPGAAPVAPPVAPQPQAQPPAPAQPAAGEGRPRMAEPPNRTAPVLTIVGGAGAAVGGLALIGVAFSAKSEAEGEIMWPRANEANERARRRSGAGVALGLIGVVAVVTGIVWLKVQSRAAYGVAIGPGGIGLEGRF